jgi:hypothetical protein
MSDTSLHGGSLPSLATSVSTRQHASLFYGWWILFFGGVPLTVYSFSVFLKPLRRIPRRGKSLELCFHLREWIGIQVHQQIDCFKAFRSRWSGRYRTWTEEPEKTFKE